MTPKRRHHSGSVRVQRLTLKSNKRATDLLLYDIDCYVWHKNQHNSFFCRESNVWVFTSNGRSSCPQWMEFVRHRGRLHNWKPPASWHQRPLGWGAWFRSICSMLQTCLRQTHVWHIAVHSGICAHTEVIALFLSQPLSLFCSVRCFFFYFCGVVILQHRLLAIVRGSLQRPACSLMSAWLTSSLAQISIKAPSNTRLLQMAAVCSVALFVWVALSSTC